MVTFDGHYGVDESEVVVPTVEGQSLVFPSYQAEEGGVSYVRFIRDVDKKELVYWTSDEWKEDPELVMGAIMACIQNGADSLVQDEEH